MKNLPLHIYNLLKKSWEKTNNILDILFCMTKASLQTKHLVDKNAVLKWVKS
jgi:hypothetical protein